MNPDDKEVKVETEYIYMHTNTLITKSKSIALVIMSKKMYKHPCGASIHTQSIPRYHWENCTDSYPPIMLEVSTTVSHYGCMRWREHIFFYNILGQERDNSVQYISSFPAVKHSLWLDTLKEIVQPKNANLLKMYSFSGPSNMQTNLFLYRNRFG